jgi:hypothetical protein
MPVGLLTTVFGTTTAWAGDGLRFSGPLDACMGAAAAACLPAHITAPAYLDIMHRSARYAAESSRIVAGRTSGSIKPGASSRDTVVPKALNAP